MKSKTLKEFLDKKIVTNETREVLELIEKYTNCKWIDGGKNPTHYCSKVDIDLDRYVSHSSVLNGLCSNSRRTQELNGYRYMKADEFIRKVEEEMAKFTMDDLKTGMIVTLSDKKEYLVLRDFVQRFYDGIACPKNILLDITKNPSWYCLEDFDENMENGYSKKRVMLVEVLDHVYAINGYFDISEKKSRIEVWKRNEKRIITIDGKDIEISNDSFEALKEQLLG